MKKRKNKCSVFSVQCSERNLTTDHRSLVTEKGFTLIELMTAASILGIIGLTILTTFASGFQVYERVQTYGGVQADALITLEEIEKRLKNLFPLETIPFEGDAQSMSFPTIIEVLETVDEEEQLVSTIGRISYSFDATEKELAIVQQNYSLGASDADPLEEDAIIIPFIDSLTFSYYSLSETEEEEASYSWVASWGGSEEDSEGGSIAGVKITLTYQNGGQEVEINRTVIIPAIQRTIIDIEEEEEEGEEEEGGEGEGPGA